MIPEKRLQKLINQSGTIWFDREYEIKLNPKQFSIELQFGEKVLYYQKEEISSGYDLCWELEVLREDVDQAKWEHDMFTKHTYKFEPPMWKNIKLPYHYRFIINNSFYVLDISNGKIVVMKQFKCLSTLFEGSATEDNYIRACKAVRNLLNEEEK